MSGIDSAWDEKWSEWLAWHGEKKCPIDSDCTVEFVTKGMGGGKTNNPKGLMWVQAGTQADIIAYRYKIKEPESDGGWTPEAIKAAAFSTPDEEEAWQAKEERQKRSKYHVQIRPGVWADCYDVLHAFGVTNPGDQHAIKKMLMPGKRGHKDAIQDRREAIQSLERAIELEDKQ